MEGKYTVETLAREKGMGRQSAINLLSKLRKQGYVSASGGGRQKRIYTVTRVPKEPTNGFYDMVNRYCPDKLVPRFRHIVRGRYAAENAIIDGITIGDARTLEATMHLFRHVKSWKRLFDMARRKGLEKDVLALYYRARSEIRVRRILEKYR